MHLIHLLAGITVLYGYNRQSLPPNRSPKMRESLQLVFGLRHVSKEFQHPAIQTWIVQHFGRFFHQINMRQPKVFYTNCNPNKQEVGFNFVWSSLTLFKYSKVKLKNQKHIAVDVLFKAYPYIWYHSHADPIWPDGTCKGAQVWDFWSLRF
jgi:hypothetical protein